MNASARSLIFAFRSCIVATTTSSVRCAWATSFATSASGMMPTTLAPAPIAASAIAPMSPTLAPPYTTPIPRRASATPSARAADA